MDIFELISREVSAADTALKSGKNIKKFAKQKGWKLQNWQYDNCPVYAIQVEGEKFYIGIDKANKEAFEADIYG